MDTIICTQSPSLHDYKKLVREIVNDEFLNNTIHRLSINNLVQAEQKRFKSTIKQLVKDQLSEYSLKLPIYVAKELKSQVTDFLSNNVQVLQLVNYHTDQLSLRLTQTASQTLEKLVNEPEYQMTTNAHLDALDKKCDIKIVDIQNLFHNQLTLNGKLFDDQLTTLKKTNDQELSELKEGLSKLNTLNNDFSLYRMNSAQQQKAANARIKKLESTVTIAGWLIGTTVTVTLGLLYLLKR